jgi:hypothetical protein
VRPRSSRFAIEKLDHRIFNPTTLLFLKFFVEQFICFEKAIWNLRSFTYKRCVADYKSYDKDSTLQMSNSESQAFEKAIWNLQSFTYKQFVADCKSYDKDSTLQMSNSEA